MQSRTSKLLIIIAGPTAVGKSRLAIQLALHCNTEIISVDSRQIYREMNIGVAKPEKDDLDLVRHHFIDHIRIDQAYNVGQFEEEVMEILTGYFKEHSTMIAAGGSGLYLKALMEGLDAFPVVPRSVRQKYVEIFENQGIDTLRQMLKSKDPGYFEEVDQHNPHRMIRALSVMEASGKTFSEFRTGRKKARDFEIITILLTLPRAELYERINARVDQMMKSGLLEEARKLFEFRHLESLHTVGYRELFDHFDGLISLEEAIRLIKRNSRRYAKRQMTWFRKYGDWTEFEADDENLEKKVVKYIKSG